MNLGAVGGLTLSRLTANPWHRAINTKFSPSALQVSHTSHTPSRFGDADPTNPFEILYLAEDSVAALCEVGAVLGKPWVPGSLISRRGSWTTLSVDVHLTRGVVDLTASNNLTRAKLDTTVQELTGDWEGYRLRLPGNHTGICPTQELGLALYLAGFEGFKYYSAKVPYNTNLAIFPANLDAGSYLEFTDPLTGTLKRLKRRRKLKGSP